MTPKDFKACFKVLFKLYDNLKADYKLTIGEKEHHLIFLMPFQVNIETCLSSNKMITIRCSQLLPDLLCHRPTVMPTSQHEAAAKKECKEHNQERDAADKKPAAAQKNNPSNINNDQSNKRGHTENLVATARLKVTTLHGVPALVITSDTPTIVSPQGC